MTISFLNKDKNQFKIILFVFYYLLFISAFYINENSTGGAYQDYLGYLDLINLFTYDFKGTLLTFDKYGERHSPIILIVLTPFYKYGLSDEIIRLIFFHLSIISVYFFYKCLKIKYKKTLSNYLFLISVIFFLSPVFRSLSVWPDSRIIGFHFFVISVYYYLKYFNVKKNINYCYLNIIFLAIASYFSINFCLFGFFFLTKFFKELLSSKKLLEYIILNLILIFPAFYYLFILDIFFINPGLTPGNEVNSLGVKNNFNISNKILIISSLYFFYLLPFTFYFKKNLFIKEVNLQEIFLIFLFILINIYFFNYKVNFTGGGIFFQISNYLFQNNYLFFIIASYSIFFIYITLKINKNFYNLLLLIIIFASNPQLSIYHKYYDPLLIFLFFTIYEIDIKNNYFNIKNIIILNIFSFTFLVLNFLK